MMKPELETQEEFNKRIVFAVGPMPSGPPVMLLGVADAAWEHMKDGKTHNLDLTSVGLPIKLMIFGGRTQGELMATINKHNEMAGYKTKTMFDHDFELKAPADKTPPVVTPDEAQLRRDIAYLKDLAREPSGQVPIVDGDVLDRIVARAEAAMPSEKSKLETEAVQTILSLAGTRWQDWQPRRQLERAFVNFANRWHKATPTPEPGQMFGGQ